MRRIPSEARRPPQPSEDLLDKVRFVADVKAHLPFKHRPSLPRFIAHGLRDGTMHYTAGGRFIPKLDFTLKADGSVIVHKYDAGEWESGVDAAKARALELLQLTDLNKEQIAWRLDKDAKSHRAREIARRLEVVHKDADNPSEWLALARLYGEEQSYKEMENALKNCLRSADILGKAYLAAAATASRGRGVSVAAGLPSSIDPQSLGYGRDQIVQLARDTLGKTLELLQAAGLPEAQLHETWLAHKAAIELTDESLEEYERLKGGPPSGQ